MAFESAESIYTPEKISAPVQKKKDPRRRSDCEHSPSIWTINICETTIFCYQTPKDVRLWLPAHKRSGQKNDRLVLQNQATQRAVIEQWAASEATFAWPLAKMPLQSGVPYRVGLKKGHDYSLIELILYQISANLSRTEQITEMRQRGCSQQADMLGKN